MHQLLYGKHLQLLQYNESISYVLLLLKNQYLFQSFLESTPASFKSFGLIAKGRIIFFK